MVLVALIPVLGGILVGWGGFLGFSGRLRRTGFAGVRTPASLRSDEAFAVANKVAGLPTMAAGVVAIAGGAAALAMPTMMASVIAAALGIVGLLVLVGAGGALGNRAAAALPDQEQQSGCGGCACGAGGCG